MNIDPMLRCAELRRRVRDLRAIGLQYLEIADRLAISEAQVTHYLRPSSTMGKKGGNRRDEWAKRRLKMHALHAAGFTAAEIARQLGCQGHTVRRALRMGVPAGTELPAVEAAPILPDQKTWQETLVAELAIESWTGPWF